MLKLVLIRTANRHRYSGRVDQGERVISPKGTRQKSDRKLAIRSAPITLFLNKVRVLENWIETTVTMLELAWLQKMFVFISE
ncbi:MAG: hypothetical protein JWN37_297 [Candidatus Nomurabacteria bacterium]|nr:hypothetical protein [Candidatus Nomurabacteria bacterium]